MKLLITGICGFVGSRIAASLLARQSDFQIAGIDNLLRPGSEINRSELTGRGVRVFHGDLRMRSDVDALPDTDYVIDAAANPSVLAGVDGRSSPRQLSEHNLGGTLATLLRMPLPDLVQARDGLLARDLIAQEARLIQVLALPPPGQRRHSEPGPGLSPLGEILRRIIAPPHARPSLRYWRSPCHPRRW